MVLGVRHVVLVTREPSQHPPGDELVDGAVDDDRRGVRVEVSAKLAVGLAALEDPSDRADRLHELAHPLAHFRAACDLADDDAHDVGLDPPAVEHGTDDAAELFDRRVTGRLDRMDALEQRGPVLAEDRLQHLVLRREVVIEQSVRDTGLLGDVADARRVEALPGEDAHGCVEDDPPFLLRCGRTLVQRRRRLVLGSPPMQRPLAGTLVVDFSRYLPGAFAGAELLRLGARVVRVERPGGDPMRTTAPEWYGLLHAGKEEADWKQGPELLAQADVVLESFRPGVAAQLGIGPGEAPETTVYCSITGFGVGGVHEQRAGHDLNYLGWSGVLEPTAPALPPVQVADLAGGALGAVTEILAALLERARTGKGARIVVSMPHNAH